MHRQPLSIPELAIIAGTRAALGAGIGLLAANKLSDERRAGLGWALLGVGVLSTIPILIELSRRSERPRRLRRRRFLTRAA